MIRGTTPTLTFVLPFDTDLIEVVYITLAQNGKDIIEKSMDDATVDANSLSVALSQEDTLSLNAGIPVEVQLRIRTAEGEALASDIYRTSVARILKDGEI